MEVKAGDFGGVGGKTMGVPKGSKDASSDRAGSTTFACASGAFDPLATNGLDMAPLRRYSASAVLGSRSGDQRTRSDRLPSVDVLSLFSEPHGRLGSLTQQSTGRAKLSQSVLLSVVSRVYALRSDLPDRPYVSSRLLIVDGPRDSAFGFGFVGRRCRRRYCGYSEYSSSRKLLWHVSITLRSQSRLIPPINANAAVDA